MIWAVLTGDIVDSSDMSAKALDEVMEAIRDASRQMPGWDRSDGDRTETAYARRGGDGWQIALNRPEFALRASLFVQARLRAMNDSYASRIAAATGKGSLPPDARADLNSAHGPVFEASGRLLGTLPRHTLMAHAGGGALDAAFRLADHIAQGWTRAQARAVCAMLPPGAGPRRIAADRLGVSRQAVDQALRAAGFAAIEAALEQIEAAA
jgi:hypothetical protein